MHQNKFVLCSAAALLALGLACSKSSPSPVSPSGAEEAGAGAAPDGSTLKATAPTPISPVNGAQPDALVLIAGRSAGKFDTTINPSYEFEIKTGAGATVATCAATIGGGSGATISYTPTCPLEFDQPYTWRARAVFGGAAGPWSAAASFRTPAGGYISGNELFDPLTNGKTVGNAVGTQFVGNEGIELLGHTSYVAYQLPVTLEAGEFSVMVTGIDEGSPGDKTKVMSMQEGTGDITGNDYRFTAEKRGRDYPTPGAVTFRIINGDAGDDDYINDGFRTAVAFSDERWYFWKAVWNSTSASLEVREDGPAGRRIYFSQETTNGHPYRPVPHIVYLGSPLGRNGPIDASIPGAIYKNVWVSSRPRPNLPGGLLERR